MLLSLHLSYYYILKVRSITCLLVAEASDLVSNIIYRCRSLLGFSHRLPGLSRPSTLFTPSLVLLGSGILLNVWADTGSAYTQAIGTYYSINFLIDPFWYLGFLLVGISGLYQYASICHQAYQGSLTSAHLSSEAHPEQFVPGDENAHRWRLT
ncbi:MAG TPA: hypothetical protein VIZ18_01960 [Ktedonobacteraceae bacterium]